jgi:hypothetical protein
MRRPKISHQSGQSSVELVAMLPIVAIVVLATGQLLAAGAAREAASSSAQAAAMARLQGGNPVRAARAAAPDWAKERLEVVTAGRVSRVTLAPRAVLPGVASLLTAHESADAGPR